MKCSLHNYLCNDNESKKIKGSIRKIRSHFVQNYLCNDDLIYEIRTHLLNEIRIG